MTITRRGNQCLTHVGSNARNERAEKIDSIGASCISAKATIDLAETIN